MPQPASTAARPAPSGIGRVQEEGGAGIARLAFLALVAEAAAAPKPGLVDRLGKGSHGDMDLGSFVASARAISPFIGECWAEARRFAAADPRADPALLLPRLRPIGLAAESAMYVAAGGANTHKGAIFTFGLLAAGAGLAGSPAPRAEGVARRASRIVSGIVGREFAGLPACDAAVAARAATAGKAMFAATGSGGARAEAESGFPSILGLALPRLRAGARAPGGLREADLVDALLGLMAVVDDSCVFSRGGFRGLTLVKAEAAAALAAGGAGAEPGLLRIREMGRRLEAERLSPGGSADLLAAALFLLFLEDPRT